MAVVELLDRCRGEIVDAGCVSLVRAHPRHYETVGEAERRRRLELLFDHVRTAVDTRDLGEMLAYARELAAERHSTGYDLSELQTAFNALEEAIWSSVFAHLKPDEYVEALGLVSSILGAAKDELAREYVSLATQTHVPSFDVRALFAGTERSSA
jgi:hypothetical protein